MIEIKHAVKSFDQVEAIRDLSLTIRDGEVFGLVGTNGAGKSTLLRMVAGIIRPDKGEILSDGSVIYENEELKKEIFYISDEGYVFPNSVPLEMMRFYMSVYPSFQEKRFHELMSRFGLDEKRKISTFSKGMKKQLALIIGMCAGTRYLLCDETFDGLDPAMRQVIKALIAQEILDRAFTPVIASHNLRELEDICDTVGLLHEGGVLLSKDLTELKTHMHKVQCLISDREKESALIQALDILEIKRQGTLLIITARGTREEIMAKVQEADPLFSEIIPLSLEEIFISETEVAGYEIKNILF
jgi:ABC-2 type transport system ATP-binding protein